MNYNDPEHGGTSLYDGNISETRWKTANDHQLRWYSYGYDALSRITDATANSSHYNLSNVSYDKNGDITNLSRRGAINEAATSFGNMDLLTYTYHPTSNSLRAVNDAGAASYGFRDASSLATQYTYDANGNLASDANKGITAITYNHLNLPMEIKFHNSSSQVVKYTYDATGVKLRKVIPGKTTDYAGNFVYENGSFQFLTHPEGYASHDNGQFTYTYNYLDHLGNVRLSYTDVNQHNTQPINIQIIQEKNYYPFGLAHTGYNAGVSSLGNDAAKRYGFGGKELQSESILGNILDWYDVAARNYDPAIGRWMVVDPLAEEFPSWTPYHYVHSNPINMVDPTGMAAEHIDVTKNEDGTYKIVGGQANSDKNIYIVDGNGKRTGEVVGEMLTEYSFHHEDGSAVKGANIDLTDQSGQNFFNDEITNVGLFEYMDNAKGTEPLDFKHKGMSDRNESTSVTQHHYRGMSFNGKVASARDIGNYSAGYVSGKHGLSWGLFRFGFDALQTKQVKGTWNTVLFYPFNRVREGQPTQQAQRAGHNVGYPIFKQRQLDKQMERATNPWPIGPKY